MPDTIAGWKTVAEGLRPEACAFHRDLEIRHATRGSTAPARVVQVGGHGGLRVAPCPARLVPAPAGPDRRGEWTSAQPRSRGAAEPDVNTIRETNNAIFDDIFWAHLPYAIAEDGIERLRALLAHSPTTRPSSRFKEIDQGAASWRTGQPPPRRDGWPRTSSGTATSSCSSTSSARGATELDRLSCLFARVFSMGRPRASRCVDCATKPPTSPRSTVRPRTRRPAGPEAQAWPRITRYDDRWRWIVTASCPASGGSTSTRPWSTPACAASSTKRATTRRTPAFCRRALMNT